jgi:hypothetical protein
MSFGIPVRNGLSIGLLASTFLTSGSGRLVPRLTLNFLTGGPLDPRITFSRTTNATLVDATGRVTYAPNNLVTYSEQFDNAAWTKTNSTITANATTAPDGTLTADKHIPNAGATMGVGASETRVFQSPTATIGVNYVYSMYAKAGEYDEIQFAAIATPTVTARFSLTLGTVISGAGATITSVGDGWYRCALPIVAGATGALAIRWSASSSTVSVGDGTSGIFVWGSQFEAVTYQTLPSTYVQTVASAYYGPRFDYNPVTLAPRGLLIEEQRVNLVTYSQEPSNAAWSKVRSSITADVMIAPDGTLTGDKLVEDTSVTNTHRVSVAGISMTSGTSYTWSIFLKAGERTSVVVALNSTSAGNAFTTNPLFFVDLLTGAITSVSASVTASSAVLFPNGWWRVSVSATATLTTTNFPTVLLAEGGTNAYTGDGVSGAFLWGGQVEAGAFPTSYIPTVASTVTRAADDASMTGTNFSSWYNQSEGTIVSDFGPFFRTSGNPGVAQIDDGSATNTVRIYAGSVVSPVFSVNVGGVGQAFLNSGILAPSVISKVAGAYALNNFAKSANGNTPDTDASGTVPVVNRMLIGSGTAGVNFLNGYMRSITYYPTRLTNVQLQALTS